jgi:peptidoglycan/xylan/chitin deacetylase (PgdA/CDA1 family)
MNRPITLCYHALSERWPAALSVTPRRFEEQIELLLARGYRGVTLSELIESSWDPKLVAITFDDAFRSVIELAAPILSRHGLPATMFVPTAFVGKDALVWAGVDRWLDGPYRDEMTPLSWDQLAALSDAGWEIGSHTRTHARLTTLEDAALEQELRRSREECEANLGKPCRALAYPYGDHDQRVMAAAGEAGYSAAATLTDELRWPPSPLRWPRAGIYHSDHLLHFRLKVSPGVRLLRRRISERGRDRDTVGH